MTTKTSIIRTCRQCEKLACDFPVAVDKRFPSTAREYLEAEITGENVLCPSCDWTAGHLIEVFGFDHYLHRVVCSVSRGEPILCALCGHRALHYILENGPYDYEALMNECFGQ